MKGARALTFGLGLIAATALPAVAGGTLPCIPVLDGRCEIWATIHDAGASHASQSVVLTSPDGTRVFSAGMIQSADGFRALVDGHDAASGERRWTASAGRAGDAYASASALATSADGLTVFMAGSTCAVLTDSSTCDLLVEAYDAATGARRWSAIPEGNGLASAQDVDVNDDGEVLVAGQTFAPETDEDYLLAAYDPESGELRWSATYDGPAHGFDRGAELALAGDVAVVTGRSAGLSDDDIATVAFDASGKDAGQVLWTQRIDGGNGNDEATGIDAAGSTVVVAGMSARTTPGQAPLVAAYATGTGKELWVARYQDPGIGGGQLFDVAVSRDGRTAVAAGYTQRSDGKGPSTLAYDVVTGQRRWVQNLVEGLGFAVALSPNGERAYVTGSTYERRGIQHRTISYDLATGNERWRGLYEESAPPGGITNTVLFPTAIAISPDGTHLYVGGQHVALGQTASDGLVLAYQA